MLVDFLLELKYDRTLWAAIHHRSVMGKPSDRVLLNQMSVEAFIVKCYPDSAKNPSSVSLMGSYQLATTHLTSQWNVTLLAVSICLAWFGLNGCIWSIPITCLRTRERAHSCIHTRARARALVNSYTYWQAVFTGNNRTYHVPVELYRENEYIIMIKTFYAQPVTPNRHSPTLIPNCVLAPAWPNWQRGGCRIYGIWVQTRAGLNQKGVSSFTSPHYRRRSLGPFSLPRGQKWL